MAYDTTNSIVGAESGGDPNAQNPNSSASGLGQFIDGTFLSVLKAHHPEIAQGKTDAELLALKNDPVLGRQLTSDYASDNQAHLKQNGLPVTPGTTYLAHFAGPSGAVKVLQADPGADVGSILGPDVVKANPFLKGMTAQGLQAWAAKKMGTPAPVAGVQPTPEAAPTQPPAPPVPPQQAPVFAGAAPTPQAAPTAQAAPAMPIFAKAPAQAAPQQVAPAMQAPAAPAPQVFAPQRRPIDLSGLRAALAARGAPIFANQG